MSEIASSADVGTDKNPRITARYARSVFWVMYLISFLNYLDRNVLTGAANVVAKELGFGLDGIGSLATAFIVIYTLGTIPLGIWADRAKRKNVVAACVAVWSVATAATALASNFSTLFISRMMLGIGEAGYFPAGTALMGDCFARSKRSRIMSWWSTAQLFGILVGFGVGGAVAGLYPGSWRLAFIFTGIPGLLLAWFVWRVREPRRNQADDEAAEQEIAEIGGAPEIEEATHTIHVSANAFKQFLSLLRIKTLAVLIVMQVFAFFVLGVNVVFLPTYLQQKDTFGLSSGAAGLFSGAVIVLAGIAGTVLGGYMADALNKRFPGARVLVCGIGFLLAAPAFAAAVTFHNFTVFTIFFVLTTLLVSVYTGPSTAATMDVVPSVLRASAISVSLLFAHLLGDAFSPTLVGVLATSFDPTHGMHFKLGVAGQDLSVALLWTCTPALIIAGLIGVFGAGWMRSDTEAAERANRAAKG